MKELFFKYFLGNDSKWGTPVPIPNTEVKPLNADDSECENRKLPRIFFCVKKATTTPIIVVFLSKNSYSFSYYIYLNR